LPIGGFEQEFENCLMIEGIQNERNKDRAMKKQSLTKKTSFFDENTKEKKYQI